MTAIPAGLRARLQADYRPVRVLPSPLVRAIWIIPIALVVLCAAPVAFSVRADAPRLGWFGVWGLSLAQTLMGLAVVVAALRESVPGRSWNRLAIASWLSVPLLLLIAVTLFSWRVSPVRLDAGWWLVGVMCCVASLSTALPLVALAAVLASRAYPTRPTIAGVLLGLGAGMVADAGWRVFCHFSQPSHVLSAHVAAVIASAIIGAILSSMLVRRG